MMHAGGWGEPRASSRAEPREQAAGNRGQQEGGGGLANRLIDPEDLANPFTREPICIRKEGRSQRGTVLSSLT